MSVVSITPRGFPVPASEEERLAELAAYGFLDGKPQDVLDQICRLAADVFHTPVAVVSLLGKDEQVFAARCGLDYERTPREVSFCAWTVAGGEVLVVEDAAEDPRFAANPLVTGDMKVRFYAGAPLVLRPGVVLGALALIDNAPRQFGREECEQLQRMAELVTNDFRRRRAMIELARREQALERVAYVDTLTGLPNRALFQREFTEAVERAQRRDGKVGLIMLDLDHLKDVNDTLGYEAGDALLKSVADRLSQAYRKTDTVARLGGDEFAVIVPHINGYEDLARPTEKVMELLRHPLEHGGKSLSITASVGAAIFPDDDADPAQLLKNADIALHQAKAQGRNRITLFEAGMRTAVEKRIEMLREVRAGLTRGEFVLHYQPLVAIGQNGAKSRGQQRVVGFEGLMRWRHPMRGVLSPAVFMPAFEDQELGLMLGDAALDSALSCMRAWLDAGVDFGRVAVNVSAAQFRTGRLAETLFERLDQWKVPADKLAVEVTETVYMGWGAEVVADAVRALHKAGVQIALDDFGTGYASLSNLKQFPIDRLKIDRAFVQNEADRAIVKAVIALGAGLGMQTVAEGVEEPEQLEFLAECGCDQAQGFLFARPMAAEDVPAFLADFAAGKKTKAA
jgi:diguanylate cyclase (GGDEF)-like protein